MIGTLPCGIPVTANGRSVSSIGQPLPLQLRPHRCNHPADILIGSAPTCEHHLSDLIRVDGRASLEQLLGPIRPLRCPARRV